MERWKKRAGLLLSLFLLLFPHVSCLAREKSEEPDKLHSQAAVLMDADSGRVLFSKNGDEKKAMASTTKIMTCILVLEHGQVVERGDHDELLAQKGLYYQLYNGMFELS